MRIGTKTLLFGVHQVILHPLMVARAWRMLYGPIRDLRLWIAFIVHDLGYWGLPNLDGPEGQLHPYLGARIMGRLFGPEWYRFCLYHSRHLARAMGEPHSPLAVADKLAICCYPEWLYFFLARASGEIVEYREEARKGIRQNPRFAMHCAKWAYTQDDRDWYRAVRAYMMEWVLKHKDGQQDTVTPVRHQTNPLERN
jgi:hypothetical protein